VVQIARAHGKRGRVYCAIASGGTAEPLPFIASWEINQGNDKAEVTAMGDTQKTYVAGMADAQGSFRGFLDDATAQTYTAAIDGLARKWYLYPDLTSNTKYWYGEILPDFSASGGVAGANSLSSSWAAASAILRSW
jgi:hypothetical protein